ncbi:MAG: hypothetical protein LBT16_02955 [Treponema sp.]|nr:hypothetical protein [Treponema sp.]
MIDNNGQAPAAVQVFAESCLPVLQSGEYTIAVSQTTKALGNSNDTVKTFTIEGPRFSLLPEEINSVYPPSGMKGSFDLSLPHIVFNRKTLPWERALEGPSPVHVEKKAAAPVKQPPWMALLLFCGNEVPEKRTGEVGKVFAGSLEDTYFPALNFGDEEKSELCTYIDIDTHTFKNIVPWPDELALLSHARKIDPALKRAAADDGEWKSVIVGNRLPSASAEGLLCRACLVSLENFGDYEKSPAIDAKQKVRLAVLYSWDFYCCVEKYHLEELFKNLSVDAYTLHSEEMNSDAAGIIQNGYVPLEHTLRNGDTAVSFYRGPLVPLQLKKTMVPVDSGDSLYRYDPRIGIFDVSYAAAWQQGRLLALANKSIALKLMRLRKKAVHRLHREAAGELFKRGFTYAEKFDGIAGTGAQNADFRFGTAVLSCLEENLEKKL